MDRELESRRALNVGLQQLIAFTGVLLAAAFALGSRIGKADVDCAGQTLLTIFFVGAILGLLVVLLVALFGLGPQSRTLRFSGSTLLRGSETPRCEKTYLRSKSRQWRISPKAINGELNAIGSP
ncbi:MAG: hypothetical protein ACRDLL_02925 [Solirubrobacterales bacterium]